MANRIKGLFLDLDGTLADSLPVMLLAYTAFLDRFGKVGSQAEFDSLNGPPLEDIVTTLAETHRLSPPIEELIAVYRKMIWVSYEDVKPNAGAEELLETAKALGYKICVVTSNFSNLTWAWLQRAGLDEMVDTVVAGDEVKQGKPHPQPYLMALAKTACLADESLAVEDSVTGARSSTAAGIQTLFLSAEKIPSGASYISTLNDVTAFLINKR